MIVAPLHPEEGSRLEALLKYEVLDTEDEAAIDELTQLASEICGTEISLVSFIDKDRQWFKSKVGLDVSETPRDIAFCSHAILREGLFEIPDASKDPRFQDNPFVTETPGIRYYAGAPLISDNGMPLGTLCVIDSQTKTLTDHQKHALEVLAKQVMTQLELRLKYRQMERLNKEREQVFSILAHDLKSPFNGILGLSRILQQQANSLTPERLQQMADGILTSSTKVYHLLDELLQWARNRLGAVDAQIKAQALSSLIKETTEFLQESFEHKNIDLDNQVASDIYIQADGALTKAVLRNLLTNAVKFTPKEGVIKIEAKHIEDYIEISVSDTGEGLSDDLKQHLFTGVVNNSDNNFAAQGNGLGLMLSAEFIKKQKGKIWVDETYTQGARICFTLPKAR
ncbi:ATP-binding protein [Bermanella sp. R86510]|uniref:GAF domain-containing sensor histidine kinase n=1 Tax=unclassified Bermanella TaxID=2627862 RepID=UPI0037C9E9CD